MKKHSYAPELTVFSGLAILFVVAIHASASALSILYPSANGYDDAGMVLRSFFNLVSCSVPMFIFASGFKFFLHDKQTSYFIFLKKRLPRVLMSFFLINTLFWLLDSIIWMESFNPILLIKTYLASWLGYTVAYPLWYIPMYCFVILLCPLVSRLIHDSRIRFTLYLTLGIAQIIASIYVPILSKKPFTFLAYPMFFELGTIVAEYNLKKYLSQRFPLALIYLPLIVLISCAAPSLSRSGLFSYLILDTLGVLIYFQLSALLQENKILFWLGTISYPIFLFHEPILGHLTTNLLKNLHITMVGAYLFLWIILVLFATTALIYLLKHLHLNRLLWEFRLKCI